jgi:large subunit ribosomal protein L6
MSRVGKKSIDIPNGVEVTLEGNLVTVKGSKGQLKRVLDKEVSIKKEDNKILVEKASSGKVAREKWGLYRTLVSNMVVGVSNGFSKNLHIQGVGYRAIVQGKFLSLNLGYSHDIKFYIPEAIEVKCPKATIIELSSYDKEALGKFAAEIRDLRAPEPYKGKGVKYEGEYIFRKEGKK